ncbi:hypothetical protein BU52_03260 [Streptomyces toyocaensis]|uniref:Uncharacterized protein n=1 Tax=Streptomyces toyocaensis TaxID=55952 RepID=A0A081XZV9_STRTO|nr:hypothetical protein [Streptomyces toyocaensis]KES09082.1 hypothetical protein BU52_03260 [Streptomyces toyocaensis]
MLLIPCAALLLACVLGQGTAWAASPSDAEKVFCLTGAGRQGVVDAAVALGLAAPGSTGTTIDPTGGGAESLGLEAWQKREQADFRRACAAHVKAVGLAQGAQPSSPASPGFLTWLLPLLVGAALTVGSAEFRSTRERGLADANGIRAASGAFRDTVSSYAAAWSETAVGARPSSTALDAARRQLVTTLRRATAGRGEWGFAAQLVSDLEGPRYRFELTDGWQADRTVGRLKDRVERLGALLGALESDVERIATAVQELTPGPRRRMRRDAPASPSCPVR